MGVSEIELESVTLNVGHCDCIGVHESIRGLIIVSLSQ